MRPSTFNASFIFAICAAFGPISTAYGQPASDDSGDAEPQEEQEQEQEASDSELVSADAPKLGVGLRLRQVFFPQSMVEIFMEEAASGMSNTGFGLDFVRRKGDFEISVGFEYESVAPDDGYYTESGGTPGANDGKTDFVEFPDLSWLTIDAAFVYHTKLHKMVSLRYGGGIGFGYVMGDVIQTDAICTGSNIQTSCQPNLNGAQVNDKQDFFRFPPVINLLGGVQITPTDKVAINVELGMRTLFYAGLGVQYFL